MASSILNGKSIRYLPKEFIFKDSRQNVPLISHLGILEQANRFTFSYEVEWANNQVSLNYHCKTKGWTEGQRFRRIQEGLGTLNVFLEALGILKAFQAPLEDRFSLLDVVKKTPFMLSYDDGSPFWSKPLHVAVLTGRPNIQRPFLNDESVNNTLTDLVLQGLNDSPLFYGLFQILFQGTRIPAVLNPPRSSSEMDKKRKSRRELILERERLDFLQTGSFSGEVRILLMDFDRTRVYRAQTALTSLLRHFGLETSRYPCWYKLKRLPPILSAIRRRSLVNRQSISGKRLAQLLKLPVRQYPGLQRLSPHLLSFRPPPMTIRGTLMGLPIIDGKESHNPYYISEEDLSNHMGIWGATGMGKSRFLYGLILDLARQGYPVTIFDPKGEYADLANDLEEIMLLRPGSREFPFQINILEVPPNLTEEDHLGFLHSTLMNIFLTQDIHMQPQMGSVLMQALRYAITNRLTFGELLSILQWPENKLITELRVQGTNLEASAHAVANRLRVLTFGICGEIFIGDTSISMNDILSRSCVIDLSTFENVESLQARKVFLEVFSHYLLNYLRKKYHSTHAPGEIEHILVIEEAQKLVPQKIRPVYSDEQSLLGKIPWTLRGYGVALIYSGTEPTVETPILNNTGMTVMFYSRYRPESLAELLGIQKKEYLGYREVQSLLGPQKYALISQKGQDGVFLLKVKDVEKKPIPASKLLDLQEKLIQTKPYRDATKLTNRIREPVDSSISPQPIVTSETNSSQKPEGHRTPTSVSGSELVKASRQIKGSISKKEIPPGEFWFGKRIKTNDPAIGRNEKREQNTKQFLMDINS